MIKLYYFIIYDESGEMNINEFNNEKELDEFLENYGTAIEVFDIRY